MRIPQERLDSNVRITKVEIAILKSLDSIPKHEVEGLTVEEITLALGRVMNTQIDKLVRHDIEKKIKKNEKRERMK